MCGGVIDLSFQPVRSVSLSRSRTRQAGRSWSSKGRSLVISRARAHARPIATIGVVNPPPWPHIQPSATHVTIFCLTSTTSFTIPGTLPAASIHDLSSATTCRGLVQRRRLIRRPSMSPSFTGSWVSGETWTDKRKHGTHGVGRKIRIVRQVFVRVEHLFWALNHDTCHPRTSLVFDLRRRRLSMHVLPPLSLLPIDKGVRDDFGESCETGHSEFYDRCVIVMGISELLKIN